MYSLDIPISSLSELQARTCQIEKSKESIKKLLHDSRRIKTLNRPDDQTWFICLKGEMNDGHEFVEELLQEGIERFIYEKDKTKKPVPGLQVNDTNLFFAQLASFWRYRLDPLVIAITGSNGKSGTKELLHFILSHIFDPKNILKSKASFNNHFGVPFTLFEISQNTRYAILELGSSHPGEIKFLSEISAPNYGIITSIGLSHIGYFNSQENIAKEKSDILRGMPLDSNLFFPDDMDFSEYVYRKAYQRGITATMVSTKELGIKILEEDVKGTSFSYRGEYFKLPVPGKHQVRNLSLILALLEKFKEERKISSSEILAGLSYLEDFKGLESRMKMISHQPFQICNDSYNANPSSFKNSIEVLAKDFSPENLVGVFGYMAELGSFELDEHKKLSQLATKYFKAIVFLSPSQAINDAFQEIWLEEKREPKELFVSGTEEKDFKEGASFLHHFLTPESCVLIKGSRSAQTERILHYLK